MISHTMCRRDSQIVMLWKQNMFVGSVGVWARRPSYQDIDFTVANTAVDHGNVMQYHHVIIHLCICFPSNSRVWMTHGWVVANNLQG